MSARICKLRCSRSLTFLLRAKSVDQVAGLRSIPLAALPDRMAMRVVGSTGTATNALRFMYCTEQRAPAMQRVVEFFSQLSSTNDAPETTSGRQCHCEAQGSVIVTGSPLRALRMPVACHPPSACCKKRLWTLE